jgi:hypothetical protein
MLIIHPVTEETVRPHIGLPVVVVCHGGHRYFGVLSGLQKDKVVLNDQPSADTANRKRKSKKVSIKGVKKKNGRTRLHSDSAPKADSPSIGDDPFVEHASPPWSHPIPPRIAIDLSSVVYIAAMV